MSAKNWSVCPKCVKLANAKTAQTIAEANKKYGTVSMDEFISLVEKLSGKQHLEETLREDYQLGVGNGTFQLNYHCHCDRCGFEFEYKHKESIPLEQSDEKENCGVGVSTLNQV
jgi:hypothetical protein